MRYSTYPIAFNCSSHTGSRVVLSTGVSRISSESRSDPSSATSSGGGSEDDVADQEEAHHQRSQDAVDEQSGVWKDTRSRNLGEKTVAYGGLIGCWKHGEISFYRGYASRMLLD